MAQDAAQIVEDPDLDFDEPLGAAQGVIAYSNLDDYYFSGEKAYAFGVYTGYKYQCVEYARRYMLLRCKCIFGQCGPAAEIFGFTTVENVETGETLPFIACKNGETTVKPAVGMTYIYPICKKMPVGHVAVISAVGDDWVGIAEQNQESKFWKGQPFGRKVPLIKNAEGKWLIEEPDPSMVLALGWLYIDGATYEESTHPESVMSTVNPITINMAAYVAPKVLEKFIAPITTKKIIARFSTALAPPSLPKFATPACSVSGAKRAELAAQYQSMIGARFSQVKADEALHHVTSVCGPHFRRCGVPRAAEWHSIYAPNEPLMIAGIGEGLKSYHVVERAARDALTTLTAEEIATTFDMPLLAAKAAADHLLSSPRASSLIAAGDCLLGTLSMVYDSTSDSYRILHSELDSLNLIIDLNALQDEHVTDHGHQAGFRMTSFGNDFNRAVKTLQKWRYGRPATDHDIYFFDFGDSAHLEAAFGFKFASADDKYQYDLERVNHLYLAHTLTEFIASKKKDLEDGDLQPEDMPGWRVVLVDNALAAINVDSAKGISVTLPGDAQSRQLLFAWKCAPWWALFEIAATIPQAAVLINFVYEKQSDFLLNPLWTHIASHPRFGPYLTAFAEKHDRSRNDGDAPIVPRVIPKECWTQGDTSLPPACTYGLKAHTGMLNPDSATKQEPRVTPTGSPILKEATIFCPAMHMMLAGGKRSGLLCLEGRRADADATETCTIYDAVHPAPMSFMPRLHGW